MTDAHVYLAIQDLGMTTSQRTTLWAVIKLMGADNNDPQPARRNHHRDRQDGMMRIVEANFTEDELSVGAFKDRLADTFGVSAATIDDAAGDNLYGRFWTFSRSAVNYFRLGVFGHPGVGLGMPDWETSRLAARRYLAANAAQWDVEE